MKRNKTRFNTVGSQWIAPDQSKFPNITVCCSGITVEEIWQAYLKIPKIQNNTRAKLYIYDGRGSTQETIITRFARIT